VYRAVGKPDRGAALVYGPNISDWPEMEALGEDLLLKVVSFITDPVTTTDELIPSGETSSFRSNPLGLAEYTLSRKDPAYVGRAKAVRRRNEALRQGAAGGSAGGGCSAGGCEELPEFGAVLAAVKGLGARGGGASAAATAVPPILQVGSAIFARKPGDGSAREQAASCQRVLGGAANFANEYATKRYRSNLINWGILPFTVEGEPPFGNGDYLFIPGVRRAVETGAPAVQAWVIRGDEAASGRRRGTEGGRDAPPLPLVLAVPELNDVERAVLLAGSLINYNRERL
jgi:aconitate hydratase